MFSGYLKPHLIWLTLFVVSFISTSHFGLLNPHLSGMLSNIFVALVFLITLFLLSFLGHKSYACLLALIWLGQIALTLGNWWHYQYFQSYFNYQSLALSSESSESFFALSEFAYTKPAIILALVSGFFLFLSIRFYKKEHFQLKRTAPLLLLLAGAAAASGTVVYNSVANYRALNMLTLSPAYFSPVHAFFIPLDSNKTISEEELVAESDFKEMNLLESDFANKVQSGDYNVIVIMLESVRASMLGYYNGDVGATPNFDAFASENMVVRNFYANTNFTVKAETAILCGMMDHNAKPPLAKFTDELSELDCLPAMLAEKGYSTRFYHGYQSDFYSRDTFLPKLGFDYRYFHADNFPDEPRRIGWGIADEAMYSIMLSDLMSLGNKRFLAHITTLSSHYPFKWDWPAAASIDVADAGSLFKNYANAVLYEDYAFGQFWQQFKQSGLADNTIVIVTADHGVWTFPDGADMQGQLGLDEQFFRMPLMIYHPDMSKHREISQIASQVDIAPTVLDMLGMPELKKHFVGKNMLDQVQQPWALMMKSGQLTMRVNDTVCRIRDRGCAGLHQECVAHQFGELFLERFSDMQQCYQINADLLQGGSYHPVELNKAWLQQGFDLINLHNKRAFGSSPIH